ncbi:hypothetical protein, partial [Kingella kingae]|uniref:hypothetical protein n=1 Tax=Kingella kingae TaxID=504 RepID=UPI0025515F89
LTAIFNIFSLFYNSLTFFSEMQKKYKRGNGLVIFPIDFQLLLPPLLHLPRSKALIFNVL